MRLLQKQMLFARMVPRLIDQAFCMGYEVTMGDAFRDPRVHGHYGVMRGYGRPSSNHKLKLAIDLNLLLDGRFLRLTEDHRPLGEWWLKQHELCEWGGTGRRNDGNHYSLKHRGRW